MEYKLSDASIINNIDFYASTLDNIYYRNRPSFNGRQGKTIQAPASKKKTAKKSASRSR